MKAMKNAETLKLEKLKTESPFRFSVFQYFSI